MNKRLTQFARSASAFGLRERANKLKDDVRDLRNSAEESLAEAEDLEADIHELLELADDRDSEDDD